MEHNVPLIATIAAGFGLALILGFVAERLKAPALVGYLLAGIIIGPATPGFVADIEIALKQGITPRAKGQFRMGPMPFHWRLEAESLEEEPALQLMTLTVAWRQGGHEYDSAVSAVTRIPEEQKQ